MITQKQADEVLWSILGTHLETGRERGTCVVNSPLAKTALQSAFECPSSVHDVIHDEDRADWRDILHSFAEAVGPAE